MTPVSLMTHDATLDNLSASEYREIWDELRQTGGDKPRSYDKCVEMLGAGPSKARWQMYEKGDAGLSREMRNALRAHVGLPQLPPTVAEATAQASPDAAVWYISEVGDKPADTVIMVAAEHELWLHVNGSVTVTQPEAQTAHVTPVTRPAIARKRYLRPCVPVEYAERLQALDGYTWQDVVEAGLRTLEQMP